MFNEAKISRPRPKP